MWKKLVVAILFLVVLAVVVAGWRFFGANTTFSGNDRFLYIPSDSANWNYLARTVRDSQFVKNPGSFEFLARQMDLDKNIKSGRYAIQPGLSLVDLVRKLRSGRQAPVNVVIPKIRTKERLASIISRRLERDSAAIYNYFDNPDTLKKYDLDTNTAMTMVFRNTYTYFWDATPEDVFEKLYAEYNKVWNEERKDQAAKRGLTPTTAYIMASIIDEETNLLEDKKNIASVYLNRIDKGMPLQADPTIKFAMRDFGLKRIYLKHLTYESPYNTYRNAGLPPGPICVPSLETLDAVLQSPDTKYLYFVAKSDFSGKSEFAETYQEHLKYAKAYQKALDIEMQKRKAREDLDPPQ